MAGSSKTLSASENLRFADLNVVHDPDNPLMTLELVKTAVKMGYDTVAINVDVEELKESSLTTDETPATEETSSNGQKAGKKKKKGANRMKEIPPPFFVEEKYLDLSILTAESRTFRQYSRLTATLTDSGQVHNLIKHNVVKQYDIVAVRPVTEQLFATIASKGEIDLITYDPGDKAPWLYKGKLVMQAVERGIGFEISYGPALLDSTIRREVFANARQLLYATRGGRGVILTSGATKPIDLRGPIDAANLMTLFGHGPELGRKCISGNAKKILLRADTKKTVKGAIHVAPVESVLPKQLQHLMKVPEFRAQIETVPPKTAPTKRTTDTEESSSDAKKQKRH